MQSAEIRQRFLDFFAEKKHVIIPSASLIPENDPTVLFTTAGMHPLVPYLLGEKHPSGTRLVNAQKCLRTDDIDEVGDNRHLTFFEMLGNWSLGDYFKQEAIAWSFEFLTHEKWLHIPPTALFVSVFSGDEVVPRDEESIAFWKEQFTRQGITAEVGTKEESATYEQALGSRIYLYGKEKNWWGPAGKIGPCGPDTEIFYDTRRTHDPIFGSICHPNCDCGRFIEIWNNVFMQYQKHEDGSLTTLAQKNVDTGMGLERITAIIQDVPSIFETDLFSSLIKKIEEISQVTDYDKNARSIRIIADHVRAAVFVIGEEQGIAPSNIGRGYILRRLIRRAIREGRKLGITGSFLRSLAEVAIKEYEIYYAELQKNRARILDELMKEEVKFARNLERGTRELEKLLRKNRLNGGRIFQLFSTYGFPWELTEEIAKEHGVQVDHHLFESEFRKHQELSRTASSGVFRGGLADHSVASTRFHTATHLLHAALREFLGSTVEQRGSNITADRLRFDFSHKGKLSPEELKKVEERVNEMIRKDLPVHVEYMSAVEAKEQGAIGLFEDRYQKFEGSQVKVYMIFDEQNRIYSKEICGGPHVSHTGELGIFRITKEESVSAGVRRIKAVLDSSEHIDAFSGNQ